MIAQEKFNRLTEELKKGNPWLLDYETYVAYLTNITQQVKNFHQEFSPIIDKDMIQGYCSFYGTLASLYNHEAKEKYRKECYLLSTLNTSITNSILAIISLLEKGLDYQIDVLIKELTHQSLFLLGISADIHKMNKIFEMRREDQYQEYDKHFSNQELLFTIEKYLSSQDITLSTHFHLPKYDPFDFLTLNYTYAASRIDVKYLNTYGMYQTRDELYYKELISLLYTLTQHYLALLKASHITYIHQDNDQDSLELWNTAFNLGSMMNAYYEYYL